MPIKSYIAIPTPGDKVKLQNSLDQVQGCETVPAQNKDVIVIVTDTDTDEQDKAIHDQINALDCLAHLTMVAGYETQNNN